jgi:hydroxymethylglutaryl-CoA lyase
VRGGEDTLRRMMNIVIHEVGMRDGLQMEHTTVPTATKLEWIRDLVASGVDVVQVGSFVHPERVPQMADTDQLFRELTGPQGRGGAAMLSGLVLNEKGLERGLTCGVELFCLGVSASETHSRKNTGMEVAEATTRIIATAKNALAAGKKVQVSVQSAFGCGYEGAVPEERVFSIIDRYLEAGLTNISLADTAGHATPAQVMKLFSGLKERGPALEMACHFHNTYGLGMANVWAAINAGASSIESSVAGLGGCPFTRIAGGNVCTEDLVHMLQHMGLRRDIRLGQIVSTAEAIAAFLERDLPGTVYKVGVLPEGVHA